MMKKYLDWKINMKRILLLLIVLATVFSLAACASENTPYPSEIADTAVTDGKAAVLDTVAEPIPDSELTVDAIMAARTLEEKVAQLFLVRCPVNGGAEMLEKYQFGGVVMFANNFANKKVGDVRAETKAYQDVSKIPVIISVDEEGGTVTRISRYKAFRSSKFLSPRELYNQGGMESIIADTIEKCDLLLSLGLNCNLGPVCDITTERGQFMYQRSLGQNAEITSEFVSTVVKMMNEKGVGCSLKHFPGYGSAGDSHIEITTDNRPYSEFLTKDFLPFIAGFEAGAGCLMVSHNIMGSVDSLMPASLSKAVHDIIRNDLGYNCVITTDDLGMSAVTRYTDAATAAVVAIEAGNDMLCCTDYEIQYDAVLRSVINGRLTEERIDESVRRILLWKYSLGLLG